MSARRRQRARLDRLDRLERAPAHAGVGHERWLMSYADLITLLLALFTSLYAISRVDRAKAAAASRSVADALRRPTQEASPTSGGAAAGDGRSAIGERAAPPTSIVPPIALDFDAAIQRAIEGTALRGRVSVRGRSDGIAITVDDAALFPSGSAELTPEAVVGLAALGRALAERPYERIVVEGHTDSQPVKSGRYRSNLQLSTARAERVVELLAREAGLARERLVASGYGEHMPITTNDTPEGRAKNRRVDLVVRVPSTAQTSTSTSTTNRDRSSHE